MTTATRTTFRFDRRCVRRASGDPGWDTGAGAIPPFLPVVSTGIGEGKIGGTGQELAELRALAADPAQEWLFNLFIASTAFVGGMAFQDWLQSRPDVQAKIRATATRVGRYLGEVAGAFSEELARQGAAPVR